MQYIRVAELNNKSGEKVHIVGFVSKIRNQKRMQFLIVQDRTGAVQITNEKKIVPDELENTISSLTVGSAVEVIGEVVANEQVKLGKIEIIAEKIIIHSLSFPELPISEDSGYELQLNWRFLALRRPENSLIFEVQTSIEQAMREFWYEQSFIEIHSPKLMHSASESGAETFSLDYFSLGKAYLAQSPQFYKQMAMSAGFERVFEIAPAFRAEPSFTSKHATEFISVDVEISWIDSHDDIMKFEEQWLSYVLKRVKEKHGKMIAEKFNVEISIPSLPMPRIPMAEAHHILKSLGHEVPSTTKQGDIDPEGERLLAAHIQKETGSELFFLTDYPVNLRPFYHMRSSENPQLTKSFDLMWKGVEVTTGAQREHRYKILTKQAEEVGLANSVHYYLDFFKYGCPPHGGFGFGLSRMIMVLLNLPSIREATFLHRGPQRLTP